MSPGLGLTLNLRPSRFLSGLARNHAWAYDEAMHLAREGMRRRTNFVGAHRVLTAAAGTAGRDDGV